MAPSNNCNRNPMTTAGVSMLSCSYIRVSRWATMVASSQTSQPPNHTMAAPIAYPG